MACLYDGISLQNQRPVNMDSLLMKERAIDGRSVCMAVVCDGVGSMTDGAFAASSAVRMLGSWFDQLRETGRLGLRLRDAVREVDRTIAQTAQRRGLKTAATLSALVVDRERYYIVHAGDSRIYGCWDGVLTQLTQDHSSGGKLTSCIGRSGEAELYYNEGRCGEGIFLLCTDGLYKRMDPAFLQEELFRATPRTLGRAIRRLTRYVMERGERDNISLALVIRER